MPTTNDKYIDRYFYALGIDLEQFRTNMQQADRSLSGDDSCKASNVNNVAGAAGVGSGKGTAGAGVSRMARGSTRGAAGGER